MAEAAEGFDHGEKEGTEGSFSILGFSEQGKSTNRGARLSGKALALTIKTSVTSASLWFKSLCYLRPLCDLLRSVFTQRLDFWLSEIQGTGGHGPGFANDPAVAE